MQSKTVMVCSQKWSFKNMLAVEKV